MSVLARLRGLLTASRRGQLSRRQFLAAAAAVGLGAEAADELGSMREQPLIASFLPGAPMISLTAMNVGEVASCFVAHVYGMQLGGICPVAATSQDLIAPGERRRFDVVMQSDLPEPYVGLVAAPEDGAFLAISEIRRKPGRRGMGTRRA